MKNHRLKPLFYKLFTGTVFPAWSKQLKGVKLIVHPLMPIFHFWKSVDKESHFVYDNFIAEGDIVFDVGGNVGIHSCYFAKKFKNTLVYSFEPLPENVEYFKKIIFVNKFSNIHLVETALGAETGKIYFDTSSNNHQGHITNQHTKLSVSITTLDDFIKDEKVYPNFIKIDVEGYESDVLTGFEGMIAKVSPSILIELHSSAQSKKVADFFRLLNYRIFRLEDHKTGDKNKTFTEISNTSTGSEAPSGFWGTILALPSTKTSKMALLMNG
jgi:FkbM family methyltransferase